LLRKMSSRILAYQCGIAGRQAVYEKVMRPQPRAGMQKARVEGEKVRGGVVRRRAGAVGNKRTVAVYNVNRAQRSCVVVRRCCVRGQCTRRRRTRKVVVRSVDGSMRGAWQVVVNSAAKGVAFRALFMLRVR